MVGNKDKSKDMREGVADGEHNDVNVVSIRVVREANLHWLERSVIGKLKERDVSKEMEVVGLGTVLIRKYSGNEYIITLEELGLVEKLKEEDWSFLQTWFNNCMLWLKNMWCNVRVIWVACYGIPIHAWTLQTFKNIAERWGDFIQMDSVTLEMKGFSKGCMQISTKLLNKIEEAFDLQVGDNRFPVKAIEINHDCEFTGPYCYEELNFALRKLGLDNIDTQFNSEAVSNGGEDEELVSLEKEIPARHEGQTCGPITKVMPRWTNDKRISWVEVTRGLRVNVEEHAGAEALLTTRNEEYFEDGANVTLTLVRSRETVMESSKAIVEGHESLDKNDKSIDNCRSMCINMIFDPVNQSLCTSKVHYHGHGNKDLMSNALVVWNEGRVEDVVNFGPHNDKPMILNRESEDVFNMGLVEFVGQVDDSECGLVKAEDVQMLQENREVYGEFRGNKARKLKKWRWIKEVAKEEEFFRKHNRKGKTNKKNFQRKVVTCDSFSGDDRIANQSISDRDF
ncbi:hypothetical protein REPUB_Repub15cG0071900 [Reevesia pubescens]